MNDEEPTWGSSAIRVTIATALASSLFLLSLSVCAYRADDVVVESVAVSPKESVPGRDAFSRLQQGLKDMSARCFSEALQRDPGSEGNALLAVEIKSDEDEVAIIFQELSPTSPVFMGCVRRYRSFDLTSFHDQQSAFAFVTAYQEGALTAGKPFRPESIRLRLIEENDQAKLKATPQKNTIPERPLGD